MKASVELVVVPDTYQRLLKFTVQDCEHLLDAQEAEALARAMLYELHERTSLLPEDEIIKTYEAHKGQYGYGLRWLARKFNTNHMAIKRVLDRHEATKSVA